MPYKKPKKREAYGSLEGDPSKKKPKKLPVKERGLLPMTVKGQGGYRPNGGRKSRAEELGLPHLIEDTLGPDAKAEVIRKLYDRAMNDDSDIALKLLAEYMFGKPTENKQIQKITKILVQYGVNIGGLIMPAAQESTKDSSKPKEIQSH